MLISTEISTVCLYCKINENQYNILKNRNYCVANNSNFDRNIDTLLPHLQSNKYSKVHNKTKLENIIEEFQ